jgi:hypothetical protein
LRLKNPFINKNLNKDLHIFLFSTKAIINGLSLETFLIFDKNRMPCHGMSWLHAMSGTDAISV